MTPERRKELRALAEDAKERPSSVFTRRKLNVKLNPQTVLRLLAIADAADETEKALEKCLLSIHGSGSWRCAGCGEYMAQGQSHGRADHAPGCDGSCRNCPVEVECGPVNDETDAAIRNIAAAFERLRKARGE
ncbi:MAG: hypothetical protein ACT4PE_05655 [Candidatus Eiseniibacteriota bacterium]